MTSTPNIWNISDAIQIELFVGNPNTGAGETGEASNITLTIQRMSDNKYWNGLSWTSSSTNLTMTEIDATNQKGRYTYTLAGSANNQADKYIVHAIVDDPPLFEAMDAYELHVSRENIRTYESEPSIRS